MTRADRFTIAQMNSDHDDLSVNQSETSSDWDTAGTSRSHAATVRVYVWPRKSVYGTLMLSTHYRRQLVCDTVVVALLAHNES